jgi:hypothetical protein
VTEEEQRQIDDLYRLVRGLAADLVNLRQTLIAAGITPPAPVRGEANLTVQQYAAKNNLTDRAVYMRIKRKTLRAVKYPGLGYLIPIP